MRTNEDQEDQEALPIDHDPKSPEQIEAESLAS